MDGNHGIERIAYSNIGIKEINAGYQVVAKSSGITAADEDGFAKAISSVGSVVNDFGYTEALIEVSGAAYFTNISMTTDDNGRICPISSAIATDGVKWRELMAQPEKLLSCSRRYFLTSSPENAEPGSPAELEAISDLVSDGEMPQLSELRKKYNLDDEKYFELISCVYYCLAAKTYEKLHIALPAEMLTPQNAREIIYCICMALPAALRAQLTYKLGAIPLGTMITIGSVAGLKSARNYVDLCTEDNKGYKCENLRGMSFCRDIVSHAGDREFLSKMNEFIEEGNLYISPMSVNFNQDTKSGGKNYLFAGAYLYASGKYEEYFSREQTAAAFTMLLLCRMSKPRTDDSDKKTAWDKVVGNLLREYGKKPLHSEESDGEIRLDANLVAEASERGWHNLAYSKDEGSVIDAEFSGFVTGDEARAAMFEKKCRKNLKMKVYLGLLTDIYSKVKISSFEKSNPNWWYELRSDYVTANNNNQTLQKLVYQAFSEKDAESKKQILRAADYGDRSLAREFIENGEAVYGAIAPDERFEKHFTILADKYPELLAGIFSSDCFCGISDKHRHDIFEKCLRHVQKIDDIIKILSSKSYAGLNDEQKNNLYKCAFSSSATDDDIFDIIHYRTFNELSDSEKGNLILALLSLRDADEFALRLMKDESFSDLGKEERIQIIKVLIQRKGTDWVRELLKVNFNLDNLYIIYSVIVEKYNQANAGFIKETVFNAEEFKKLGGEERNSLYSRFFTVEHDDCVDLLGDSSFISLAVAQRAAVYESVLNNTDNEYVIKTVVNPFAAAEFTDLEQIERIVRTSLNKLPESGKLELLDSEVFAKLSAETRTDIIRATISGKTESYIFSVINADAFAKLPAEARTDIVKSTVNGKSEDYVLAVAESRAFKELSEMAKPGILAELIKSGQSEQYAINLISKAKLTTGTKAELYKTLFADCGDGLKADLAESDDYKEVPETDRCAMVSEWLKSCSDETIVGRVLNTDTVVNMNPDEKGRALSSVFAVNGEKEKLLKDILCGNLFTQIKPESKRTLTKTFFEKPRNADTTLEVLGSPEFCKSLPESKKEAFELVVKHNNDEQILVPMLCGQAASTLDNASKKELISSFLMGIPSTKAITDVLNSDTVKPMPQDDKLEIISKVPDTVDNLSAILRCDMFKNLNGDGRACVYRSILANCEDENLLTEVLCTDDLPNSTFDLFTEFAGSLVPEKIRSDSKLLQIIHCEGMGKLNQETGARIIMDAAKMLSSDSMSELLETDYVLNAAGCDRNAIAGQTVSRFSARDDSLIISKVFSGKLLNGLLPEDKAQPFIDFFTGKHSDGDTIAAIKTENFSQLPSHVIKQILDSALKSMSGNLRGLSLFGTEAFNAFSDNEREDRFRTFMFNNTSPDFILECLNSKELSNMSREKLTDFVKQAIELEVPSNRVMDTLCFELLEDREKLKIIDPVAKTLRDYTSRVGSEALSESLPGNDTLLNMAVKELKLEDKNPLAAALYETLQTRLCNSVSATEELSRLYELKPELIKSFFKKVYAEKDCRWKNFNRTADEYYSAYCPLPKSLKKIKKELARAKQDGLTKYAYKLEAAKNKKTVPAVIGSVAGAVLVVGAAAFTLYVGPKLFDIDLLNVYPHEYTMKATDENPGIISAGYDEMHRELKINTASGNMYVFFDVPQEVYDAFLKTDKKGKFYNSNIRGEYSHTLILSEGNPDAEYEITKTPDSSGFIALGYDAEEELLRTYYRSGKVYVFKDVPEEVYMELLTATNKGKYYNDNIKDNYSFELMR